MKIGIVTPAPPRSTRGNRVTAERWAGLLKTLGHRVTISEKYDNEQVDLLIALHARRSHSSIVRFRQQHPHGPIVLALTGTDVYRDIHVNARARKSLNLADRIIVLQPQALRELAPPERKKARVIYQSVERLQRLKDSAAGDHFDICVIGHLRPVKDPFRAAMAARRLPHSSRIRITQVGGALSTHMKRRALREMQINRRYRWLGDLSRARALRIIAQRRLCVISSRIEGGANALSEAIVAGVPVLASRIDGNVGILGENYPALFRCGDTGELRDLILRAETDPNFLKSLNNRIKKLAPLFNPVREERAWGRLLAELSPRARAARTGGSD
jgi:putative glycosyltransferase (TIGR04348 family)